MFNKVVTPAKIKFPSLQGNGVDTERNSAVLDEVEQGTWRLVKVHPFFGKLHRTLCPDNWYDQ